MQRENSGQNSSYRGKPRYQGKPNYSQNESNGYRSPRFDQRENVTSYRTEYRNNNNGNRNYYIFLENAMEKLQREFARQIQVQIEMQFQQLQERQYKEDYPYVQRPRNPDMMDMFRPRGNQK